MTRHILSISHWILGGTAFQRWRKWLDLTLGFSRCGEAAVRPRRLKPHSQQCRDRSAEALRHPKSSSILSHSAITCALVVCTLSAFAGAADAAPGDVVLRALREEMVRSKAQLKMDNVPAPYYIEYRSEERRV